MREDPILHYSSILNFVCIFLMYLTNFLGPGNITPTAIAMVIARKLPIIPSVSVTDTNLVIFFDRNAMQENGADNLKSVYFLCLSYLKSVYLCA